VPKTNGYHKKIDVTKYTANGPESAEASIIIESPMTIFVNGEELVTLLCLGRGLEYLTAGFLWSENVISSKSEIDSIVPDYGRGTVQVKIAKDNAFIKDLVFKRLVTTACGKGSSFYTIDETAAKLPENTAEVLFYAADIISLVAEFENMSELHEKTRGVHSALLARGREKVIFHDDIGRHNAIDKVLGHALLTDVPVSDKMVVSSGRISSEVLLKVAKKGVPVLVSRAQPTDLAVDLADRLGITLVGFVRNGAMNVYTHPHRIS